MKTAYGVYYNLAHSEWFYEVKGIRFVFSSEFYLNNFRDSYLDAVEKFNRSMNKMYKNKYYLEMDALALVRLYLRIEKRGFYLIIEGVEVTCLEDLAFVGTVNLKIKSVN